MRTTCPQHASLQLLRPVAATTPFRRARRAERHCCKLKRHSPRALAVQDFADVVQSFPLLTGAVATTGELFEGHDDSFVLKHTDHSKLCSDWRCRCWPVESVASFDHGRGLSARQRGTSTTNCSRQSSQRRCPRFWGVRQTWSRSGCRGITLYHMLCCLVSLMTSSTTIMHVRCLNLRLPLVTHATRPPG